MRFILILFTLFFLTSCQTPAPDKCPLTPVDTRKNEELCRHFAGEEPYNAERAAFLKRKMQELNCGFYF